MIDWLRRYQRYPNLRRGILRPIYQDSCRVYGDEVNLRINGIDHMISQFQAMWLKDYWEKIFTSTTLKRLTS